MALFHALSLRFSAFLIFEACVGSFWPLMASLRSKYIKDDSRCAVLSIFRFEMQNRFSAEFIQSQIFFNKIIYVDLRLCISYYTTHLGNQTSAAAYYNLLLKLVKFSKYV